MLAEDDLRRGFREGLVVGVFPVFDCFAVMWVVCAEDSVLSIREEYVLGSEKVVCIRLYLMIHTDAY